MLRREMTSRLSVTHSLLSPFIENQWRFWMKDIKWKNSKIFFRDKILTVQILRNISGWVVRIFVLYEDSFYKITKKQCALLTVKLCPPSYSTRLKKNKLSKIIGKHYALFSFMKLPITFERNFQFTNLINFFNFTAVSWIVWSRH